MLELCIPGEELYDEDTEEFFTIDDIHVTLEHSLISLSKWEQKYQKPFLENSEKTREETLAYVDAMVVTSTSPDPIGELLRAPQLKEINDYIDSPATATVFTSHGPNRPGKSQVITSELVYYWMIAHTIPFECQTWHLNRLFALIRVCNIKNDTNPKKMSRQEIASRNRSLNEERKAMLGTRG